MSGRSARWGDLHVGDTIAGRDGKVWRVDSREVDLAARSGWIAQGGGALADTFGLVDETGRIIRGSRHLADPVPLLTRADRSEFDRVCDAFARVGIEVTMIREGSSVSVTANPCQHPEDSRSVLTDGRHYCTACFETTYDPRLPAEPVTVAEVRAAEALPYFYAVDSTGVEYMIPNEQRVEACAAGIHPKASIQWDGERLAGCSACGLVFPQYVHDYATAHQLAEIDPVEVDDPVEPEVSEPAATVVAVTTVTDRPAQPDPFADTDPAPAPVHYEVKRDRWGRYVLPHPVTGVEQSWTRATTLARCLSDETKLVEWKLRMAVAGVARNRDLIALAGSAEIEDKATLNKVVEAAHARVETDKGANLGTAFHAYTHRLSRGESFESLRAPVELHPDLHAYQRALREHALTEVPELVERIVVNTELNAAGTFDRFVRQGGTSTNPHPTPLSVLDLKTARTVEYSWLDIAIQLAIYVNASHLWDPATRTYTPLPSAEVLDRARGLVLHLPVGKAEPVLWAVNLVEGWEAAKVAERVRRYRNGSKGYGWLVDPDPQTLLLHRVSIASQAELAELFERHRTTGMWTPVVHEAGLERLALLSKVPQ